ncbi:translation initiation factor IF-2-like [Onychostruthus taczanowskii]|uniref:translation initiation factor IF-2-like n=1 Tax=Onychostruthus taczanowskii TaxID=356909 RepID=UPI001B8030AE|nr:translation initiation factor IF-2-like [Onychostruthus taczanowskii]
MDDDDEDEDEDGDGDPDAPPAPAAPLLLTSASSTSASHRWPQPPPTSTVRHIDTATDRPPPPPLPRPHTAPAPPAHRPSPGADTHPPPRRPHGLGWGRAGLRGNRGAGPGRDAAPRGAPRTPPRTAPRPLLQRSRTLSPPLLFLFIYFPVEKEKPLLNASGRSPHTGCAPQDAAPGAALGARPGGARSPRAPLEPGGGSAPPSPRRASAARGGGGGGSRGRPGGWEGGREQSSALCARETKSGERGRFPAAPAGTAAGARGGGGLPEQGPAWLAACRPGCGAGLSLITRDLTCPGGQRGLGLPRGGGERRGLAAGEKSGHGARKRPRPRTFLPGAAPTRSAARGGSGHRPKGTPEPPPRGPGPAVSPSLSPPLAPGAGAGTAPRAPLIHPRGAPARPLSLPVSSPPSRGRSCGCAGSALGARVLNHGTARTDRGAAR